MKGTIVRLSDDWLQNNFGYRAVLSGDIPEWAKRTGIVEFMQKNEKQWYLCGVRWSDGKFSTIHITNLVDLDGQPLYG